MLWPISSRRARSRLLLEGDDLAVRDRTGRCPSTSASSAVTGCAAIVMSARRSMCASTARCSPCGRDDRRRGSGSSRRRSARSAAPPGARRRPCPGYQFGLSGVCSAARISTKPWLKTIHPVRLRDVPVERGRVELRQHEDAADVGVQAVADRDVDQAVLAADRDRRLRAVLRERKQARALSAAENDRQNFVVHRACDTQSVHRPAPLRLYDNADRHRAPITGLVLQRANRSMQLPGLWRSADSARRKVLHRLPGAGRRAEAGRAAARGDARRRTARSGTRPTRSRKSSTSATSSRTRSSSG